MQHDTASPLYVPSSSQDSHINKFVLRTNKTHALSLASYEDLYNWSIDHTDLFWGDVWDDTGVVGHKGNHVVDTTALPPANPPWFSEAKLNWAENMLQCRSSDKTALVEASTSLGCPPPFLRIDSEYIPVEPHPGMSDSAPLRRVSYADLYALVADLVSALLSIGLKPGDRVASYASNCIVRMRTFSTWARRGSLPPRLPSETCVFCRPFM